GAGLLLADRPAARVARVRGEPGEQGGPADAGLHGHEAALGIKTGDAVERAEVEHPAAGQELLSAHGVPRAHDGERLVGPGCGTDRVDGLRDAGGTDDGANPGRVEARMDVVEFGAGGDVRLGAGGKGRHRVGSCFGTWTPSGRV